MIDIILTNTGKTLQVEPGTTLMQINKSLELDGKVRMLAATINNVPHPLSTPLYQNSTVNFIAENTGLGRRIYFNSLVMVLYKTIQEVLPGGSLVVEHSISNGYFCQITQNGESIDNTTLSRLKAWMREIIDSDIPFIPHTVPTVQAQKLFGTSILNYKRHFYSTYWSLDNTIFYSPSCMAPSTKYLKVFDIQPYYDGFLIMLPSYSGENPEAINPLVLLPKLYNTYKDTWGLEYKTKLTSVEGINRLKRDEIQQLIQVTEALHEKKIVRIADKITNNPDVKVVLIAGPSSSGKTTFSKRLSVQLLASGVKPVALSLDNYFINRDTTPLDENGEHDFETLYALDLERFSSDLEGLITGNEVETPIYNFETGKREAKGVKYSIKSGEVLVIEGIHALNPELTKQLPSKTLFKVFVSALNTMSLDNHHCIPADDTRLLRRIIRDYKYRGYSAEATILRWPSVRRGEKKWIEPYQENADEMFNSSLLFELAAIRRQAEPILREVPHYSDAYTAAYRIIEMLNFIRPISFNDIPATSLLREFLGGSGFKY